jgi:hypothetical protein
MAIDRAAYEREMQNLQLNDLMRSQMDAMNTGVSSYMYGAPNQYAQNPAPYPKRVEPKKPNRKLLLCT